MTLIHSSIWLRKYVLGAYFCFRVKFLKIVIAF